MQSVAPRDSVAGGGSKVAGADAAALHLSSPPRRVAAAAGGSGSSAVPPLPKDTTVLHIGDSFAAALGIELNRALKDRGVRGVLKYRTASFIPGWAWSKSLPVWLAHHDPDLVIITLGANELAIKKPETRAATIRKLVGRLEGRPCVWIAIPLWKIDTGLLQVIRENAAPCRYMDTNAIIDDMERVDDGIHPTMAERKRWATVVVEWLARQRMPDARQVWALRPLPTNE